MLINIILLLAVFGAAKKKFSPYAAAAILGAAKGVLYFVGSHSLVAAFIGFLIFGGLAAAMVFFLARIDKKELVEDPYPKYGYRKKGTFKWEYVPLSASVLLLVFGEMVATMFLV